MPGIMLRWKKLTKLTTSIILVVFLLVIFAILWVLNNYQADVTPAYPESIEANGQVKEFSLTASPGEISLLDSDAFDVWSYNNQVPGPELKVTKGDTIKINFTNQLPQATTIHFHGIRVPNAMDGVPGVTQDPIKPGETFIYQFTPKDAGTYWYHPHVRGSEQVERGLYGVIVVEDPQEPKYDQDQVIVLDDWRIDQTGQLDERFNTGHDLMHDGRWGNAITVNGKDSYRLEVKAGERLRLRFINTSNARVYKLDFGELFVKGFAVDGMLAREPFNAQGIELAPGNRLDVDVTVPMVSRSYPYLIRDSFTRDTNNLVSIGIQDSLSTESVITTPQASDFPDWSSISSYRIDKEYKLNARRGGQFGIEWTINGKAYPDYDPITLKKGQFNVIRFTNESYRLHPMHLHGQFFKVIAKNGQTVNEPYLRDTVLIKSQETIDIALVPLDEGMWANHCHALEHAEAGMMTLVEVK